MNFVKTIAKNRKFDWVLLALIGLALQGFWALRMEHPSYMDAYYYTTNGQRLADGFGFTEEVIWQFLDEPQGFPAPSHTYWMPLTSMLAAVGYRFSDQFSAVQIPFWLLAGLLPLLAYQISHDLTNQRWQAWAAALFTASGGFYNNFYNQPSTFAPFAWCGCVCLWALARGSKVENGRYWWFLAGISAGLGHLTRADGVLLLIVGGFALFIYFGVKRIWRALMSSLFLLGSGYLFVMGGWFWRTWQLTGRPLSTVGTQTIFLTTYDDLFAYGRSFDLTHLIDWGWGNILSSRVDGIVLVLGSFVAVSCLIFLTPFVIWGWWRLMKKKWEMLMPGSLYLLLLFVSMSLLFTFPGGRGGFFHSSAAIFPWLMALAAAGVEFCVNWIAKRLSHWQPERASRLFAGLFVAVAMTMSVALGIVRSSDAVAETAVYEQLGDQLPPDAIVMVGNAPGFYYHAQLPATSVPNEPPEILIQVAKRYQISHLVLDINHPIPLDAFYDGDIILPEIQFVADYDGIKLYEFTITSN
ncbi:MAG: hypothetical protein GY943_08845 [Chloroflexi bacterium]|nr:hypothetical protein [Chloroflexota bacterium]